MTTMNTTTSADVGAQLKDLERQGGGMARGAHICAGLLLVAFSLGSLISISAAATLRWLAEWQLGTFDLPDTISIVVNFLLVVCADWALLYAASVLRTLIEGQAPRAEMRVHVWAMIGAAVMESASYLYLVWVFDRPSTAFLWAIAFARAGCAPLFACYLSMARPLPVGPRDVAYQAALASGKGVVRDVATLAADPNAPLARKVRIYRASALMAPNDAKRFDAIVEAVSEDDAQDAKNEPPEWQPVYTPPTLPSAPMPAPVLPPLPPKPGPTGGTPAAMPARREQDGDTAALAASASKRSRPGAKRPGVVRLPRPAREPAEQRIRAVLAARPGASVRLIARRAGVSESTASKWRALLMQEEANASKQSPEQAEGQAAQ